MSRMIKILGAIAVLLVAVLVAGVAVLKSQDFNQFRGIIAEQVEAATGRKLTIAGDLTLEVSLSPSVVVEGVGLANAAWGSRPEMLKIGRFEAKVELVPLLSGDIRVERVVLKGLDALLETDAKGRGNWQFDGPGAKAPDSAPADAQAPLKLPVVRLVELRDIAVVFNDGQTGRRIAFNLDRLISSSQGIDKPLDIEVAGVFNGEAMGAEGRLGSIAALLDGVRPWPVSLAADIAGLTARVDGTIAKPLLGTGLDLRVSADTADPAALGKVFGIDLPKLPKIKASARLKDVGGGYGLDEIAATIGASDVAGRMHLAIGGARPSVDLDLVSKVLDLDELQSSMGSAPAPAAKADDGRIFPADAIPLDGLKAADVKLALKAASLIGNGITLSDVDLGLLMKGGRLAVKPFTFALGGGTIGAQVTVDGVSPTPMLTVKAETRGVNFGKVLIDLGQQDLLSTRIDADIDIRGSGESIRAIMAGLNGTTAIVGREGRINSDAFGALTTGFLDALPWANKTDANQINCIVSRFDIKQGMAGSRALIFDTNGITVSGEGSLNLADETIAMTISTSAKSPSLAALAIPLNIGGTFAKPSFTPNVGAAVVGAVSGAVGTVGGIAKAPINLLGNLLGGNKTATDPSQSDDPCVRALSSKSGTAAPASQSTKQTPPPPQNQGPSGNIIEGIGEIGKGVGKSLGKLFGN